VIRLDTLQPIGLTAPVRGPWHSFTLPPVNPHQLLAIQALYGMRDELPRVRRQFAGFSEQRMREPYGSTGHTPRELLAMYERRDAEIAAAIAWVRGLKT
jgi:hypothetical protein